MEKTESRALSDLGTAARRLTALFRRHGFKEEARLLMNAYALARHAMKQIRVREKG